MFKALLLTRTEDRKTRAEQVDMVDDRLPDLPVTVGVEELDAERQRRACAPGFLEDKVRGRSVVDVRR